MIISFNYSAVLNVAEDANTVEPLTLDLAMSVLEIQLGKSTASSIDPNSNISSLEIVAGGPFLGTQMTIGGDGTVTPVNGSFTKQVQVGFGSAPRIGDNPVVRLYAVWDKEIVRPGNIQTVMTTTENIPYKAFAKVNSTIVEGEVTAIGFEFSSVLSDNLLLNGDFEEELEGWGFDSDARYLTQSEYEGYGGGR